MPLIFNNISIGNKIAGGIPPTSPSRLHLACPVIQVSQSSNNVIDGILMSMISSTVTNHCYFWYSTHEHLRALYAPCSFISPFPHHCLSPTTNPPSSPSLPHPHPSLITKPSSSIPLSHHRPSPLLTCS